MDGKESRDTATPAKTYRKPELIKRDQLRDITAQGPVSIID